MRHAVVGLLYTVLAVAGIADAQRWVHFIEPCKAYNNTVQVQMPFLEEMVNLIIKPTETPKNVLDMYYRLPNPLRLEQEILVELRYAVCRLMAREQYDYSPAEQVVNPIRIATNQTPVCTVGSNKDPSHEPIKLCGMEPLTVIHPANPAWLQIIPVTLFFVYLVNKFMTTY